MSSDGPAMRVAVIVAHPDDETLWAGGTILMHPEWVCRIVALCRGSDPDRAPRFRRACEALRAHGAMADLDDGPDQAALDEALVTETIRALLPDRRFDLVFTHGPRGEYTRHRRHEEVNRAVTGLWEADTLRAGELRLFAYDDGGGAHLPRPAGDAEMVEDLPDALWQQKYRIITEIYGFAPDSFEARTTPRAEAFRRLTNRAMSERRC